ncbi:energry transducer TonB [Salmonella enterica subsp. enterica serovar Newport]|nr:energry transducer TonB [Salmonella enterica subsp. enterica serovar Newport]
MFYKHRKYLRCAGLALFLLAGNSFAASYNKGASGGEIANYAGVIRNSIINKSNGVLNKYEGHACTLKIHISRDGSLKSFNILGGAPDLCNKVSDIMHSIKKFPTPPSDALYQVFEDATLDFKP